jgi:hypothetical protein
VLQSKGLRLSAIGAVIFLLSIVSLVFLPNLGPVIGMLIGGVCVWAGFIWTILTYYTA